MPSNEVFIGVVKTLSIKLDEFLKRIEYHFDNITPEEFEKNLSEAGFKFIKSASEYGRELKEPDTE